MPYAILPRCNGVSPEFCISLNSPMPRGKQRYTCGLQVNCQGGRNRAGCTGDCGTAGLVRRLFRRKGDCLQQHAIATQTKAMGRARRFWWFGE